MKLVLGFLILMFIHKVVPHGHLADPPARSSAWLYNKDFVKCCTNYDHNQMFCGGTQKHWSVNGGKCGICGEDWSQTKEFEKGGRKYLGKIVRTYSQGQSIDVKVVITASHLGWFEFRICKVDGLREDATQECLNKTILTFSNTKNWRYFVVENKSMEFNLKIDLPFNLVCNHCVLQWKYRTGNSWGKDEVTGKQCVGCGNIQEHFFGCADISIISNNGYRPTTIRNRSPSRNPIQNVSTANRCKPKYNYETETLKNSIKNYCNNVCDRYCYNKNSVFNNPEIMKICDRLCPAICVCQS